MALYIRWIHMIHIYIYIYIYICIYTYIRVFRLPPWGKSRFLCWPAARGDDLRPPFIRDYCRCYVCCYLLTVVYVYRFAPCIRDYDCDRCRHWDPLRTRSGFAVMLGGMCFSEELIWARIPSKEPQPHKHRKRPSPFHRSLLSPYPRIGAELSHVVAEGARLALPLAAQAHRHDAWPRPSSDSWYKSAGWVRPKQLSRKGQPLLNKNTPENHSPSGRFGPLRMTLTALPWIIYIYVCVYVCTYIYILCRERDLY